MWGLTKKYPLALLRGSTLGTAIGALPGAGADIAAWMSYAVSKKFSKEPQKFGTGHVEGIVESGSANNSALAGAWIPALVFGIPGDSITAIVIGVLYMKNMNPGPTLFTRDPQNIYAVYLLFIIANLIMIPLGWLCIKASKRILQVPRNVLMPVMHREDAFQVMLFRMKDPSRFDALKKLLPALHSCREWYEAGCKEPSRALAPPAHRRCE
jgi:TctA family transporter